MKPPVTPALRCAICRRPIDDQNPLHVHGVGHVGSTCHRKVQDIEEKLSDLNLTYLLQPTTYPMVLIGTGYHYNPQALKLAEEARAKGIDVSITVQKGDHGPINVLTIKSTALSKILAPKPRYGGAA